MISLQKPFFIPFNKWSAAALLWLGAGVYALIFHESGGTTVPPFPHFDKLVHALLFFAQFWLAAKAFLQARRPLPLAALAVAAVLLAGASEWAQGALTQTRQADAADALADIIGAGAALFAAHYLQKRRGIV